jgi:hypothetical protein
MLFPDGPGVELRVDHGAIFKSVEPSNPGKARWIFSLKEIAGDDCPELLKRFGEVSVEILSEMFALSLFDGVSAEFNGLKVA